jgi:hypothetical protein
VWREALPVDPALGGYPKDSGFRPARFTRVVAVSGRGGQLPALETTGAAETPLTPGARFGRAMRRLLEGAPLDASALAAERMRKLVALPVLSADALSSVAYGPEAMLAVLVLAGAAGVSSSLPVGGAIMVMMLAVGVSYRQTIRAYPQGGGSYIVASEELGRVPGLVAAAGLLIDYILTVAVSVASGVAAITSAYPSMQPATVWIGVGVIIALLAGNMRGVRQAGPCSPCRRTRSSRRWPPWLSRAWPMPRTAGSTPSRPATWPSCRPSACCSCCARSHPAPRP